MPKHDLVQVLTEAYAAEKVDVPQHQILSLILCKIGAPDKVVSRPYSLPL